MIIKTTKKFDKQYLKLNQKSRQQFKARVTLFKKKPFDSQLRNHALKGRYLGYRSINISGDLRAVYYIEGDTIIIFAFVGSHSQLY